MHLNTLTALEAAMRTKDFSKAKALARRSLGTAVELLDDLADYLEALDSEGQFLFIPADAWAEYYWGNPDCHLPD